MPSLDVAINALKAKHGAQQFDSAVKKMQRSARGVDKSVAKTQKGVSLLGGGFSGLAKRVSAMAAMYAVGRYVKGSIQEMAKFEMELANVSTMLDEQTMHYLPSYGEELTRLAIEYGETTTALSKGLYDILSASIDAADALDVLQIAAQAAKAGLTDTGKAADILTTIINAYGMSADDANKIADILFATVKRGKTTFDELASTMGMVVSLSATAGMSLEEVSAALATMTRAGISTDMAMTSLRGMLVSFLSPTDQNIVAARKLGLELNSNTLRTIGLTGAVRKLEGATAEQIAEVFTNVRALMGLSALLQGTEGHMKDLGFATDATGKMLEAFAKVSDTTSMRLAQFAEKWKATKRIFGEEFKPALTPTLWVLDKLMIAAADTAPALKSLNAPFWEVAGNAFNLTAKVTSLIPGMSNLTISLRDAEKELTDMAADCLGLTKAVENLTPATKDLNAEWEKFQMQMLNLGVDWETLDRLERNTANSLKALATKGKITDEATLKFIENAKEEAKAIEETTKKVEDLIKEVQFEQSILSLTSDERERAIKLHELEAMTKDLNADASAKLAGRYNEELKTLQAMTTEKEKAEERKVVREGAEQQIESVRLEREMLFLTNEEREKAIKLREFENSTKVLGVKASAELKRQYEEELEALRAAEKQKTAGEAVKKAESLIREIQLEQEILYHTNEERERAIKLLELEVVTKDLGTEASAKLKAEYLKELETLQDMQEMKVLVDNVRAGVGDLIRVPLTALLDETQDMGDVLEATLRDLGRSVLETLYEETITKPLQDMLTKSITGMMDPLQDQLSSMLSGLMSGLMGGVSQMLGGLLGGLGGGALGGLGSLFAFKEGAVFNKGKLVTFGLGDIINKPTIFPMANGDIGLAGEKDDEAVMPLTRDDQGRLGVRAEGSGDSNIIKIYNVIDEALFEDYLSSGNGERAVINIMRRNREEAAEITL